MLVGVGLTALALVATVFVAKGWSHDNGVPAPGATWGAPAGRTDNPATGTRGLPGGPEVPSPSGSPSAASASRSAVVAHGRLRSPDTELCLDAAGGRARAGAAIVLAGCSRTASQQWSYRDDGLLRSAADPTLCLAADPGHRTTALVNCLVHAGETFFDLTVRGELLLRRDDRLVVARAAGKPGAPVVVTERDGSGGQRWVFDTVDAAPGAPGPELRESARPPAPVAPGSPDLPESRGDRPLAPDSDPGPAETAPTAPEFDTRVAQVQCCEPSDDPAGPAVPATLLDALPAPAEVSDVLANVVVDVTGPLGG